LSDHPFEPGALDAASGGTAKIVIDHLDLRPTKWLFEITRSDWAKEHRKIEDQLREREDAVDVANLREMVLADNASAEFPYPPKKIRSLLRRRRKDIEWYSDWLYRSEMLLRNNPSVTLTDPWLPAVDMEAIIKSMTAEAIHKRAFYSVGEIERLTKIDRRRRVALFVLDLPKYALIGAALILGLFPLGVVLDVLQYLHRAPNVVTARIAPSRLWR
jgi:hypothetical protein